jgi:TonB family protein
MKSLLPAFCLLALCSAAPAFGQQKATPAPQQTLNETLARAFQLISDGQFQMAKAELEKATALAGGPCGECLLGMAHVYASEGGKWDQVASTVQQALPLLGSPGLQARAYDQLGVAYVKLNASDGLSKAEEAFRRGAELGGPWGAIARYNLAEVEFRQQKWAEAADAARRYLKEAGPEGTSLQEASVLLCRARAHLSDELPPAEGEDPAPMRIEGAVTRPTLIARVNPQYTEEARKAHVNGKVILEAIIDKEGCVRNLRPLQELPNGMTEAAMAAVRNWVFSPSTRAGKPVKVYYVLTINFQVQVDDKPVGRPPGGP